MIFCEFVNLSSQKKTQQLIFFLYFFHVATIFKDWIY